MDIEKLLDEARSGRDRSSENDMTVQQQADQLREAMIAFVAPPCFTVGDLVRYKEECKGFIRNHDRMHIILELIHPPKEVPFTESCIGSNVAYRKYDVVLGVTDARDKGGVLKYVADSRELEYFPGHEKLNKKHS